jgi:hypothetical protein
MSVQSSLCGPDSGGVSSQLSKDTLSVVNFKVEVIDAKGSFIKVGQMGCGDLIQTEK